MCEINHLRVAELRSRADTERLAREARAAGRAERRAERAEHAPTEAEAALPDTASSPTDRPGRVRRRHRSFRTA
jgi:hypothetical protein